MLNPDLVSLVLKSDRGATPLHSPLSISLDTPLASLRLDGNFFLSIFSVALRATVADSWPRNGKRITAKMAAADTGPYDFYYCFRQFEALRRYSTIADPHVGFKAACFGNKP